MTDEFRKEIARLLTTNGSGCQQQVTPQLGGSQGTPGERMRAAAGSGVAGEVCLPGSAIGQLCNMRGMRAPPWKAP